MYDLFRRRTSPSRRGRRGLGAGFPEQLESRTLLSTISGRSFNDLNANGVIDPGESGHPGRTIFIDLDRDGSLSAGDVSTVTDGQGNYRFTDLPLGAYIVREAPTPGFVPTSPALGTLYVFVSGDNVDVTNQNFGSRQDLRGFGRVTGSVYEDANENGVRDAGEQGLGSFRVYADLNGNGQFEENEPSALTNSMGQYTLVVPTGNLYQIRQDAPQGWRVTQPAGLFYFAPVFSATEIAGRDFGVSRTGEEPPGSSTISGMVFNDVNNNGVNDGEPGISRRTVYVDANNNGVLDPGERSAVTDVSGAYSLDVSAGTYIVRMENPPGTVQTAPASGFHEVTIGENQNLTGFDFGSRTLAGLTISGIVYRDLANIGVRDPGEPGMAGARVYLDLNRNSQFDPGEPNAVSAADGSYAITASLDPGIYFLRQVAMPGFLTSPGLYLLTITPGTVNTPIPGRDFGNFQLSGGGSSAGMVGLASLGAGDGQSASPIGSPEPEGLLADPPSSGSGDGDGDGPIGEDSGRPKAAQVGPAVAIDPEAVDLLFDEPTGGSTSGLSEAVHLALGTFDQDPKRN